jgi:hypothetical protein
MKKQPAGKAIHKRKVYIVDTGYPECPHLEAYSTKKLAHIRLVYLGGSEESSWAHIDALTINKWEREKAIQARATIRTT